MNKKFIVEVEVSDISYHFYEVEANDQDEAEIIVNGAQNGVFYGVVNLFDRKPVGQVFRIRNTTEGEVIDQGYEKVDLERILDDDYQLPPSKRKECEHCKKFDKFIFKNGKGKIFCFSCYKANL